MGRVLKKDGGLAVVGGRVGWQLAPMGLEVGSWSQLHARNAAVAERE
jgi:hypothetical protein